MATVIPSDIEVFATECEKSFYQFLQAVAKGQGLFSRGLESIIDGWVQFDNGVNAITRIREKCLKRKIKAGRSR